MEGVVLMAINHEGIFELIDKNEQHQRESHKRLRDELTAVQERIDEGFKLFLDRQQLLTGRVSDLATKVAEPVDASKLVLTPKIVASVVITILSMAMFVWVTTASISSDVRNILTRMDAQKTALEMTVKFQEAQSTAIKMSVDEMRSRQERQQDEIQSVKEIVLRLQAQKPGGQ